jgi:hypothetical protein
VPPRASRGPTGDYDRYAGDIARAYRRLGLPEYVDAEDVARRELRWWVVRREIGLAAGEAAGDAITRLYASIYEVPESTVAEAGRLRGLAAEVRDRGATDDPDGPKDQVERTGPRWRRLLRESYRSLKTAVSDPQGRRPMNHQAAGKMPAATTSFAASHRRNLVIPSETAVSHGIPSVTLSHGTPIA